MHDHRAGSPYDATPRSTIKTTRPDPGRTSPTHKPYAQALRTSPTRASPTLGIDLRHATSRRRTTPVATSPPVWLALAVTQPIAAIRGFAEWWYARDMQPYPTGADTEAAATTAANPHALLGWYDELAFSYHHLFATDLRSRVDFNNTTYQPVYIDNQGQWRLAVDRQSSVWIYDGHTPDREWQPQPVTFAQALLQASLLEGVMSGNEFSSANDLAPSVVAPLLARVTELPLPAWTVATARFYIGAQAIVMTQRNAARLDVCIGALDAATMTKLCDGLDMSRFT